MPFLRFHKIGKERTMNIKFFNAAKRNAVTRFLAPVAVAFFSVFLASCPNSADNVPFVLPAQQTVSSAPTVSAGGTAANAEAQFITFKGSVRTGGALPASYAKALEGLGFGGTEEGVEGLSKSARPDVTADGTSIEHFAVATPNVGEPVEGTFASASSTTFEMPLAIGKKWNIVCGIRNVSGDKKIIMSDSFQIEVTVSNSVLSHVFTLTPYTEVVEGVAPRGDVALIVNFEGSAASSSASGSASVSASWEDQAGGLPALAVEGLAPALITASNVPVGNHRLAIFFRDSNGVSVYESVQVVTVLNGLTTETWMPETGEAAFTSDGHFVVNDDVIKGAASDRIYVGKPAVLASNDSVRASDSNSGSAYSPLEHLQAAFNKIQSAGSGSKDFKIFVSGEVVGNAFLNVVRDTHARSITIEGLDDPDESLKPKSALKGSESGSVFAIESNVPVTIKNLKITGGSGAGQGGGISMVTGSDLTLDSGALVTQNSATWQGGGVYNGGGSLKIKKGAAISGNWITNARENGSDGGAGLFMYGSSAACVMTGGEISDNNKNSSYNDKNVRGGGVRLGDSARMTLSGGSVSGNFSKNLGGNFFIDGAFLDISGDAKICQGRVDTFSSDDDAWGGALYVEGNSKVTMTGGEISGNTAKAKSSKYACAGVYLSKEFEMTGGVIEGNVVEGGLSSGGAFRVGGLLTIGGSAKIPYGGGEGKNDVYVCKDGDDYKVVQIAASGFSYAASDSAPAAVLAPQGWDRNHAIIKAPSGSDIGAYTPYFKTIYPDFYFGRLSGTVDTAMLKAALCVSNKANAADSDEQNGTKSQPFRTIAFALTKLNASEPDEIIIDYDPTGDVFGPQEIPDTFTTTNCSALTIRGANGLNLDGTPKDILNASGTRNAGSVLTVKSAVPITIKDLKITGGNCTDAPGDRSGGGIYLTAGELTLADGVLVVGNYASYGGGVYVKEGASLFMNGTSYIGDKTQTTASGDTLGSACSNSASYGGGIYNSGKVYLGYKKAGASIQEAEWTGGVCRNYVSDSGGGIYNRTNGDLKMRAGTVSYNRSNNYNGGGLCASSSEGHGIELLGGELKENYAGRGGAVYVESAFSMQGSPFIPYGLAGEKSYGKNDIYLADGKTIKVAGDLTLLSGESEIAAITPVGVKRTRKILSASSEDLINDNKDKFALTSDNDGWQKNYVYDSGHYAELNSPVYVVGTQNSDSTKPDDTWGWGNLYNATNGTKTSPYASVADALNCAELASATEPNTIIIAGTLKGAQSISGTSVPSDLSLKGYKTATSSAKIDAGSATDAGSALTVNSSGKTVTITDLTITGGTGSDLSGGTAKNGGGIYINAGTVKLADGAVITGNSVTTNGGGVYLAASGCALYMSGKALIGDSATSTTRAASGASNRANQAANGAGIYNNGGSVFIGSNSSGTATGYALANDDTVGHYGVRRNYSTGNGAGIYHAAGTLKIASGDISCNSGTAYSNGGGIYFAAGASIGGGTFSNGYAKNGGGLYIKTGVEVTVSGGATFTQNEAASTGDGGAVYQGGTFNMSGSAYIAPGSERSNDVYLASGKTVAITGALNPPSGVTAVATITPDSYSRGRDILSSDSANKTNLSNAMGKFKLSKDDSGWDRGDNLATTATAKKVWITSPIYVVGASGTDSTKPTGFEYGKTIANGANGTKSSPYASVADALTCADLATVKEITIAGTLVGAQQAISSPSVDITLKGYKAAGVETSSAKIQRFSTRYTTNKTDGSALKVDASGKNVTITDLTITYGAALSGAGIYITAGTVKLGDYAKINDNYAANSGGGVYVNAGATLFMYGKALIGDKLSTEAGIKVAGTDGFNDYANRAQQTGGGGIYNWGAAYIGYSGFDTDGTTLIESSIDNGYGIIRNYNTNEGGGAIYNAGTLKIGSGSISYNNGNTGGAIKCTADATISGGTFTANKALSGGAICVDASKTVTIDGSATFTKNQASSSGGGAIYNAGTLIMTAGTIGASGALNEAGTSGLGGAIYQNGTFNISGTAYVYPGSEKKNDVYLASGKTVAINGDWSGSQASTSKMTLTPANWTRGTTVVSKGSSFTSNLGAGIIGKFAPSDGEWSAVLYGSGASAVGKIDADIWVAGSGTLSSCSKAGNDSTGNGTKAKPYASITTAVGQCWGGPKDTATGGRIINVEGTVTAAANTEQTISSDITSAKATAIKLLGNGSDVTLKPASGKRVLSIYTAVPVTIQNLTISGGSTTDNGAGIYVSAAKASLTLTTGAVVTGANTTSASGMGGGIYIAGSWVGTGNAANLIMNGTAQISGNSASGTSGAGGGVYLYYANLCMSGNALIGDTSGSVAATSGSTGHSNMAKNGGGVYCDTGSNVYLGFASASDSGTTLSKGIRHNYASSCGGGIYVNGGTVTLKTGYVSYNGTAATSDCDGGGIWQKSGTTVTISGGTIAKNKGYYGGGVYAGGTFTMSGGTIGDSSDKSAAANTTSSTNYSNYAAYGGGIYAPSGASVSLNSGYVSYNYASAQGGGIKAIASITFKSNANYNGTAGDGGGIYANTFILSSGTIKGNEAAGNGGGIACAVNASYKLTISGGTVTANKALNGGGVYGGVIGMTGGTISSNTATNTAYTDEYCGGGGIFADGYYLVLTKGSIQGNISKGNGGGVLMRDSFLYMSGSAVIGDSGASAPPDAAGKTKSNNADYDGGGIYANCDGAVYIGYTNSTPTDKTKAVAVTSMAGGIYYNYSGRDGGGICNYSSSGVKIAKGNIKYNASPSGNGGGVCFTNASNECFIYDGSVDGNKALNGGGVYLDGVSLTMSGGTVSANTATNNSTTNASKNGGGGVYLNDPTNGAKYFKMTAGTIAGNTSKKNGGGLLINGGKFYMSSTAVIGYAGAGISTDASTCDDSNKADDCGGGIYAGAKSEVYIGYSDSSTLSQMSSYENSCIRCNYAKNYGGGLYTLNYNTTFFKFASGWIAFNRVGSSGYGAGIYHQGKATSYIGFSTNSYGPDIVSNSSGNAREYFYGSSSSLSSQKGGGIYNAGVITFSKGYIRSNYAKDGGGVYNASGATFTMNGANAVIGSTETFWGDDNNAIDGAGVHNGGTFTISAGCINKNRSKKYGGGVYNWGGTFTISGGQINDNEADKSQATYDCEGGGIYISGGTVNVNGGSVSSNSCGTYANSTTNCGGNIAFSNGTFNFTGGEVKGGYSKGYGNSIYAAKTFTMSGNAHTADASGGEIYLASSACINIPSNLTYKSSNTFVDGGSLAIITPSSYAYSGDAVRLLTGSAVSTNNKKFNVTTSPQGWELVIKSTGYLSSGWD